MRIAPVDRLALALALLFAGAALLFAWRESEPSAAPDLTRDGEAVFDRRCAGCHERAELAATLRESPRDLVTLERFLVGHGRALETERRALARALVGDGAAPPR